MSSGRNSFFLFNNRNRNNKFMDSMFAKKKKKSYVRRYVILTAHKLSVIRDFEVWDFLCEELFL